MFGLTQHERFLMRWDLINRCSEVALFHQLAGNKNKWDNYRKEKEASWKTCQKKIKSAE